MATNQRYTILANEHTRHLSNCIQEKIRVVEEFTR